MEQALPAALRLKSLRANSGLTQKQVAEHLGMSPSGYAAKEDPNRHKRLFLQKDFVDRLLPLFSAHGANQAQVLSLAGLSDMPEHEISFANCLALVFSAFNWVNKPLSPRRQAEITMILLRSYRKELVDVQHGEAPVGFYKAFAGLISDSQPDTTVQNADDDWQDALQAHGLFRRWPADQAAGAMEAAIARHSTVWQTVRAEVIGIFQRNKPDRNTLPIFDQNDFRPPSQIAPHAWEIAVQAGADSGKKVGRQPLDFSYRYVGKTMAHHARSAKPGSSVLARLVKLWLAARRRPEMAQLYALYATCMAAKMPLEHHGRMIIGQKSKAYSVIAAPFSHDGTTPSVVAGATIFHAATQT